MRADRREQILDASVALLEAEGLEGVHARTVAARVGVHHTSVHYYFPSRADLLAATAAEVFERFSRRRAAHVGRAAAPGARLRAQVEFIADECARKGLGMAWASLGVAAKTNESVRAELVRHLREWALVLQLDLDAAWSPEGCWIDGELLAATLLGVLLSSTVLNGTFDAQSRLEALSSALVR